MAKWRYTARSSIGFAKQYLKLKHFLKFRLKFVVFSKFNLKFNFDLD